MFVLNIFFYVSTYCLTDILIFFLAESEGKTIVSPRDKLREALSSREAFQKTYLVVSFL